jgi:hypothetical protein
MTAQRDPDRLIHEFLLDGAEHLHDQVYDAVRAEIEHRRQRAVFGPWRMPNIMNKLVPIGLGAAAIVGLFVVGGSVLRTPSSDSAGVGAAPTASPQVPPAQIPRSGPIDAGTYSVNDGRSTIRVTFPAGWEPIGTNTFRKGRDQNEVTFTVSLPYISVWPDACATEGLPTLAGPTAEDLVGALRAQQRSDVSEPAETSIGGLPGVLVEVSIPDGLDLTTCTNEVLRIWSDARANNNFLYFRGPGTYLVYIVGGEPSGRIVLTTGMAPEATAADLAELQAIIDSIQFEAAP